MLLSTLTPKQKLAEIEKDVFWLEDKYDGLYLKHGRTIRKTNKTFLGISKYKTPHNNTAYVISRRMGKGGIYFINLFESLEKDKYTDKYIKKYYVYAPIDNRISVSSTGMSNGFLISFVPHFSVRLKERMNLDFFEFLSILLHSHITISTRNGLDKAELSTSIGICRGNLIENVLFEAITFVSDNMLKGDQIEVKNKKSEIDKLVEKYLDYDKYK